MWPWGHAAVGYLLYAGYSHARHRRAPTGPAVLAVLVGTQLPDLVDKPLAWSFGVLPGGRTLAHSLLTAALVLAVLRALAGERHREAVAALAVGWVSHSLVDAAPSLASGDLAGLASLAWPLVPVPPSDPPASVLAHLATVEATPWVLFQLALVVVAVASWDRDGRPGLATVRAIPGTVTRALG